MLPISATIITLNEADNIAAAITSAQQICDEVIVVDSLSSDETVSIAESLGAKVYRQAYLGDGPQKAYGTQFAKNEWIFSLDADERIDAELVAAIQAVDLSDPNVAYTTNRRNYVGSHWIKAAGFYPDYVIRLYNKTTSAYEPRMGHAKVDAPALKQLDGHLEHFTYDNLSHWLERLNWLSTRDAKAMYQQGKPESRSAPITHAIAAAIRSALIKKGFFQGLDGFTVVMMTSFSTYLKYMKVNELHQQAREQQNKD